MEINTHGKVTMYSIICLANYEINIILCDNAIVGRCDYNNHKQFLTIVEVSISLFWINNRVIC